MKTTLTHLAAALLGALASIGFFIGWDRVERKRRGY